MGKHTTLFSACLLAMIGLPGHADTTSQAAPTKLKTVEVNADGDEATEGSGTYGTKKSRSATKLNLTLKETPQSISVVNREQMEQQGLTNLDDILAATPGVYTTKLDSERSNYYARGFAINNRQIDGLPVGDNSPRFDNFFFDRIETIKGATGLLGSTGSPSATINMVRKRPTTDFRATLAATYGRWDHQRLEADVSGTISANGNVRARVMAANTEEDSYMDRYHEDSRVGMAIVEADFTPSTLVSIGVQYQKNNPTGSSWGTVPYWNQDGSLANLPRSFNMAASWSTIKSNDLTVFAELQQAFANDWQLKAVISQTSSDSNWIVAYGGSGFPNPETGAGLSLWTGIWPYSNNEKFNMDLYATGPFNLFNRTHELILGYSGFTSKNITHNVTTNVQYPAQIADYRTWKGDIAKPTYYKNGSGSDNTTDIYGAYTTLKLNLADPLQLLLGARFSAYEYESNNWTATRAKAPSADPRDLDEVTPYVGLLYDINERFTAYASYTDMFQPSSRKDKHNNYLDPETGTSYEVGLKSDWNDGRLLTTLAAFWSEKDDLAVADTEYNAWVQDAIANGAPADSFDVLSAYIASGQGLKVEGYEIEAIGLAGERWNVSLGYTYVKSTSSAIASELRDVPKQQVKLGSSYTLPNTLWSGAQQTTIGGNLRWQDDIDNNWGGAPANSVGNGVISQKAYYLADVYINHQFTKSLSANLNIDNLFDEKYYTNVGFYNGVYWGEPRNIRLSLRARF